MAVDNFIMYPKYSQYYNIALCNTCIQGPPLENGTLFLPIIINCLKYNHPLQHKQSYPLFFQIWHALYMWPCYAIVNFPKWMTPASYGCAQNEPNLRQIPFHYIHILLTDVIYPWFLVTKLTIPHLNFILLFAKSTCYRWGSWQGKWNATNLSSMIGKRTDANYDFHWSIALNSKPPNLNAYIVLQKP